MQPKTRADVEFRRDRRLRVPPMYTLIRVRPPGRRKYIWSGHIYDVSSTGLRFELDTPVAPGTPIDVRVTLPGAGGTTVSLSGHVVRWHDDADEPGPVRMGMAFDTFARPVDRFRLLEYLRAHAARAAA